MWKKFSQIWQRYQKTLAIFAGVVGFLVFLVQAWAYAQNLPTDVWDESMYLYKGYLFASVRYQPFEDFGPWTNQLPVSFLIPGYIQKWFGPGMYTGRVYALVVGAFTIIGLWWTVKRNANLWWAAGVVWVFVFNPTYSQVFSQSFAQTLVSMFFAWMLFFGLGKDRQNWELALAAFLTGLAGMARVNVLPALPLFVLYVFWQHGARAGWISLIAGAFPVLGIHALYWPDILKFWAYWIPTDIFPGIAAYRSPWREIFLPDSFSWVPISGWLNDPDHLAWVGVRAFWQAIRVNFVVVFGVLVAMTLWRWRGGGKLGLQVGIFSQNKQFVYLAVSFFGMYLVHLFAANGQGCRFVCLPGYLMFFFVFGLVLIPVSASRWRMEMPVWGAVGIVVLSLGLLLTLEYNYSNDYLDFRYDVVRQTFDAEIPRLKDGRIVEGTGMVWELLQNKFGYNHFPLRRFILKSETVVHLLRLIKMVGLIGIISPLAYWIAGKTNQRAIGFGVFTILLVLATGMIFSGARLFGGHLVKETCESSVIESYEQVGTDLDALIPDGSQLYWRVKADMLLLYLPDVEIYTPQLNDIFTFTEETTTDPQLLYRFGWWNPILKEQWVGEADFIVIENRFFDEEWQTRINGGEFEIVFTSQPAASCRGDDSRIVVLKPVD